MTISSLARYTQCTVPVDHRYACILAGGNGERLWPLSRRDNPKQLLSITGRETLLEQAIMRMLLVMSQENIWISTTEKHAPHIRDHYRHLIGNISIEPATRNTGPAILWTCFEILEKDPQAIVMFAPADPFIPERDSVLFKKHVEQAFEHAHQTQHITLLGVQPTYAATGYGYIEYVAGQDAGPHTVKQFHEKPSAAIAQEYIQNPTMLWNIGMFCGPAKTFIDEFAYHAPDMFQQVLNVRAGLLPFESVTSDSIDYAIMEKSDRIDVLPVNFSWCDVGSIEIFLSLKQEYSAKDTACEVISVQSHNNLVDVPHKVVALVGVDDLCIVQSGDTLLISKRDASENVKAVVGALKINQNLQSLL